MVAWAQRCKCTSFVNKKFRCNRKALANGRCTAHSLPVHKDWPLWVELPVSKQSHEGENRGFL